MHCTVSVLTLLFFEFFPSPLRFQVTNRVYIPFPLDFSAYPTPAASPPTFNSTLESFEAVFGIVASAAGTILPIEIYDPWDLAVAGGSADVLRLSASCVDGCGAASGSGLPLDGFGSEWCAGCDVAGALVAEAQVAAGDSRPPIIAWLRQPAYYLPDSVSERRASSGSARRAVPIRDLLQGSKARRGAGLACRLGSESIHRPAHRALGDCRRSAVSQTAAVRRRRLRPFGPRLAPQAVGCRPTRSHGSWLWPLPCPEARVASGPFL